tara:strand:+ start:329 stop:502 length:174 start_codon:yes stop_codon:yes gene_type:complete
VGEFASFFAGVSTAVSVDLTLSSEGAGGDVLASEGAGAVVGAGAGVGTEGVARGGSA